MPTLVRTEKHYTATQQDPFHQISQKVEVRNMGEWKGVVCLLLCLLPFFETDEDHLPYQHEEAICRSIGEARLCVSSTSGQTIPSSLQPAVPVDPKHPFFAPLAQPKQHQISSSHPTASGWADISSCATSSPLQPLATLSERACR